jgi:hypothetical protein
MRAPKTPETGNTATPTQTVSTVPANQAATASDQEIAANLTPEQTAYRDGFEEGFLAAQEKGSTSSAYRPANTSTRRVGSSSSQRQAYNHSTRSQPQKRSFWQKHRDKLTVAAGTGGGALVGGLLGGKKGALIGGLAGAGGSALYTYKLRNRARKY